MHGGSKQNDRKNLLYMILHEVLCTGSVLIRSEPMRDSSFDFMYYSIILFQFESIMSCRKWFCICEIVMYDN